MAAAAATRTSCSRVLIARCLQRMPVMACSDAGSTMSPMASTVNLGFKVSSSSFRFIVVITECQLLLLLFLSQRRLSSASMTSIPISACVLQPMFPDRRIPMVLKPVKDEVRSAKALKQYVAQHIEVLKKVVYMQYGALLMRGWEDLTPQDFEDIIALFEPHLSAVYHGTSPRTPVTKYVFTASEVPPHFPIPQHNEMSFIPKMKPDTIAFFCEVEPQSFGQTPIADSRQIVKDLEKEDKPLLDKIRQNVLYSRNYPGPNEKSLDPTCLKPWKDIYSTTDKKAVEKQLNDDGLMWEWRKNDGLHVVNECPGTIKHHLTGEEVFSNHAVTFHLASQGTEILRLFRQSKASTHLILGLCVFLLTTVLLLVKKPLRQSMACLFSAKEPMSWFQVQKISDIVHKNTVQFDWKKGDLLVLDNHLVSHGRNPFRKPRRILTAFGGRPYAHEKDH